MTIYTTYISVDLAHHEIFRAKVGKGGISTRTCTFACVFLLSSYIVCNKNHLFNLLIIHWLKYLEHL